MPIVVIPKIPQTTVEPPNPLDEQAAISYVFSFKGRTGDVLPASGDYSSSLIGNASGVAGANVSDALDQLDSDIDGLSAIYQPLDAGLTSIAGLTTAADKMIYTTAHDVYTTTDLTTYARSLLDDADAPTARATLDAVGGRSALTLNNIPKVDANGDLVDSSVTDDGSTVTFSGNVTINGTTTIVDSEVVAIGDSMMKYAKDNTASDVVDIGWYGVYGSGGTKYSGVFRDASDGKFKFYSGLEVEPTTTVNVAGAGYAQATLVAAIESSSATITGGTINGVTYDSLQLNTGAGTPSHSEGLMFYDATNKCVAYYNDVTDSTLQIGQELWVRVKNNTGLDINNGDIVYLSGQDSGIPTVALAAADSFSSSVPTLGFATHTITNGSIGLITAFGTVRDLNTSGCSAGDILYLSNTAGEFTTTAPTSPSYQIILGSCTVSHASTGEILVDVNPLTNTNDVINFWNGSILEDHTINVSSNGTTIICTLEKNGGGDLNLFFNGGFSAFDSTPAASVNLTAGSDTVPTRNYVYILESTGLLTASTAGFPATQHVRVADVICPSAATMQTEEAYKNHAWTDHLSSSSDQGHLSDINYWIRNQHATWVSGVTPTFSGSGTATVGLSSTSGVALQLHDHAFPAFSDPAEIFIYNHSATPYTKITNIHDITLDSTGASLNNSTFGLVIWGVVSEETDECKFFCNLPSGGYGAGKPALVRADADIYQDFSIPEEYKGCAFLVYRLVISRNAGGTATTLYVGGSGDDLRGTIPGSTGGSAAATVATAFSDNAFDIYNVSDNTKVINFSAASITTGNTRTITMADRDIDLATMVNGYSNLTTPYRMTYVNAAGEITESSSIVTDASGGLTVSGAATGAIMSTDTTSTTSFVRVLGDLSSQNLFNWQTGTAMRFASSTQAYSTFVEHARFLSSGALLINTTTAYGSEKLGVNGDVYANGFYDCATAKGLKVAGTQVVTNQGAAVADSTDAASAITQLNALLARCRAHGLIAT